MYPDKIPPIAEVINMPNKIYVFVVSETCHTCSKNMGKLLDAVKMASLNKKYASKKNPTLDNENNNLVSYIISFIPDLNINLVDSFFGSLKKISIVSDKIKKAKTEGKRVSALAAEPNKLKVPFEKGRAINNPINCPK